MSIATVLAIAIILGALVANAMHVQAQLRALRAHIRLIEGENGRLVEVASALRDTIKELQRCVPEAEHGLPKQDVGAADSVSAAHDRAAYELGWNSAKAAKAEEFRALSEQSEEADPFTQGWNAFMRAAHAAKEGA